MPSISFSSRIINAFVTMMLLSIATACSKPNKNHDVLYTSPHSSIFGKNVLVFNDSMNQDSIKMTLHALHEQQKYSEFGSERYALLFKPGTYDFDVTVDYYIKALGLGRYPGDVNINGAVQSITTI